MEVAQFLRLIGRNTAQYASKIQSMTDLSSSAKLKEMGVSIRDRKYILQWLSKFRAGIEPHEIPAQKKGIRGPKWRY